MKSNVKIMNQLISEWLTYLMFKVIVFPVRNIRDILSWMLEGTREMSLSH